MLDKSCYDNTQKTSFLGYGPRTLPKHDFPLFLFKNTYFYIKARYAAFQTTAKKTKLKFLLFFMTMRLSPHNSFTSRENHKEYQNPSVTKIYSVGLNHKPFPVDHLKIRKINYSLNILFLTQYLSKQTK